MKRLVSLALLLVMVLTILPVNAFAASPTGEKFWIEDNVLYWEQEDGVTYDLVFYQGTEHAIEVATFKEISGGSFNLSKGPVKPSLARVFKSGTDIQVASFDYLINGLISLIVFHELADVSLNKGTGNSTYLCEWTDLGATRYKIKYGYTNISWSYKIDEVYDTLIVDNGATSAEIPSLNNRVTDVYVTALDGLYAGQTIFPLPSTQFSYSVESYALKLTPTNINRFEITTNNGKYMVSWGEIEDVTEFRFSYKKPSDSEYTVLKPQTKLFVNLPFTEDDTFSIYLEAKIDGEWQWIGSRTINGETSLGDTPETYASGGAVNATASSNEITGFWAQTKGDGVVNLYWNAVKGADNYKVYYRKVGASKWSGGSGSFLRTKTNLSVKLKNSSSYEFKIVAGDKESEVLTIKPNAAKGTVVWAMNPNSKVDYKTNLSAVVNDAKNGKITLSWDKVKGAEYKVYFRKAGASKWSGGYDKTGESITLTFKESNTRSTYEIKIVADGKESDIFTITPSVWTNAK